MISNHRLGILGLAMLSGSLGRVLRESMDVPAQTNQMTPEELAAAAPVKESRQVRRARERRERKDLGRY